MEMSCGAGRDAVELVIGSRRRQWRRRSPAASAWNPGSATEVIASVTFHVDMFTADCAWRSGWTLEEEKQSVLSAVRSSSDTKLQTSMHKEEVGEYYKSKHKKIGRYLTSLRARCEEQGERLDEIAADAKSINRRLDALEAFLESDLQTMGEQMRKMATQEKATAMDLIEFMEQHLSKPPDPDPFAL
uniref:Uncharacterized protein n=1 Tax=Leersia perrieri TaxID=77586 RepID=A0A0D9VV08_9ORYZ